MDISAMFPLVAERLAVGVQIRLPFIVVLFQQRTGAAVHIGIVVQHHRTHLDVGMGGYTSGYLIFKSKHAWADAP